MQWLITILIIAVSCAAQNAPGSDPKGLYEQAMNKLTGAGVSRNDIAGIDLMTRSAELGYAPSQVAMGYIYEVGGPTTAQPTRAADWYRKAAANGSHLGEYLLGRMYFTGEISGGNTEAEKWLGAAANAGNPFAEFLLAKSIYGRDPSAGLKWFRAAAEQGLPYAQLLLGRALLDGRAGAVDRHQAYQWLFVSHESGVSEAESEMNAIEGVLGSNETEKAKSEARDLQRNVRRTVVAKGCTGWPGELDPIPSPPPLEFQQFCN